MKIPTTALLLAATALLTPIHAADYKLPEKDPVISFSFPEKWEASEYEGGVEATSADGEVYIAIENIDVKGVDKSIDAAIKYLKSKGVTPKEDSIAQHQAKKDGMDIVDIAWSGTDKEGPCQITLSIIAATETKGVMMIYWASPDGEKKNIADLNKITKSLKPTKAVEEKKEKIKEEGE